MKSFLQVVLVGTVLGLCFATSGCTKNNESEANIQGEAPPPGSVPDYGSQNRGASTDSLKSQGYPGAK